MSFPRVDYVVVGSFGAAPFAFPYALGICSSR